MQKLTQFIVLLAFSVPASAAEEVDYVRDVFPIFETYCIGCHTQDEAQGGLVMESYALLMNGGEHGLAITAGVPTSSRLFLMASGKLEPVMPPDGEPGPSEEELATLATWIEQGAIGPDGDMPIKRELRTPKIDTADGVVLPITAITASSDGSVRAVARYGKVEVIGADGKPTQTIVGDFGKVNQLTFSGDGGRILLASGSTGAYGIASIHSVATGKMDVEMVGHRDVLYAAIFSPDETQVATAGYDREIILWDAATGEAIRRFTGHNGAIFDLAFSPDGKILVSACADETLKVWNVETGERLDTLSQPEGEVYAVDITADGKHIVAASSDNRLRIWELRSTDKPRINPLIVTRFVDESALVNFAFTSDAKAMVVLSEAGKLKVIRTSDWTQATSLPQVGPGASDLAITDDGKTVLVSMMNGKTEVRSLPALTESQAVASENITPVYLDLGELATVNESGAGPTDVPRGAKVVGKIAAPGELDSYRWNARRGEMWAIEAKSTGRTDPIVAIVDDSGKPVLRVRLQAIRDTYFTFRGKNSNQMDDFRLFNWEEMNLNDYLYAGGEVTRLSMHPRGPDSGFNVYPNEGDRWTYFGTSQATHALGEPAYIVRPLRTGEEPIANGLPVFDIFYENDDDPMRLIGNGSKILFNAPEDGRYTIQVTDTRGEGGDEYGYELTIRGVAPAFNPTVTKIEKPLLRGSGREFSVRIDRVDGFDGPVTFDVEGLPPEVVSNFPLTIESGQKYAEGTLWVDQAAKGWEGKVSPQVTASAEVLGKRFERRVGSLGELTIGDRPNVIASIQPTGSATAPDEDWTLQVRRGETISARVILDRKDGFTTEVSFGKENAGRNTTHGVYVSNIGLNGLLALEGMTERDFFLTADPMAKPGKRSFFLTAATDGGVTSHPITVEVLP